MEQENEEMYNNSYFYMEEFVCNHCKSVYEREVFECSNCGSTEFTRRAGSVRYRYIKSNGNRLTDDIIKAGETSKLDEGISYWRGAMNEIVKCLLFTTILVSGSAAIVYFSQSNFAIIPMVLYWILLVYSTIKLSGFVKKRKAEKGSRNKGIVPENYLLLDGLDYDIGKIPGEKNKYVIRVKYFTSNGICITLKSKKPFKYFRYGKVDLLINPDDINDYLIDFNLHTIPYLNNC